MGLIHQIAADPEARAAEVAAAIAESSPTAIRGGLAYVVQARGKDFETAGEIARRIRGEVAGKPRFRGGPARLSRETRSHSGLRCQDLG